MVLALGLPTPVRAGAAEDARIAELQQRLDESLRLIADLSMRVRQLEQAKATDVAAAAPVTPARDANPNRLEAVEAKVAQIESASASRRADDSGLAMHGFADVGAGSRNPFDAELKGFNIGNLDFYLTPRLGDRTLTAPSASISSGRRSGMYSAITRRLGWAASTPHTATPIPRCTMAPGSTTRCGDLRSSALRITAA
jgi:hypothetical protein